MSKAASKAVSDQDVIDDSRTGLEVAVVGMAGRFPGAADPDELWANVAAGTESISHFSDAELDAAGVPAELRAQPGYVAAGGVLTDPELFDARFFGYGPREAEILDPQHRLFLEWSWQALEDAGIDPARDRRPVGVWGGTDVNTYLLFHLMGNRELVALVGAQQLRYANRPDTLATRVAYHLDLTGPAVTVQTTCSTSLVAIHFACQSLLNGECDAALAGGVSVDVGQRQGYLARQGGVLSPDGHVRAFDAAAAGMVSGNGGGVVALKRLEDAEADGDRVLAVIKGSAINNDGARKVSYTAPGVDGQARVVRAAQIVAEVEAASIRYVEAHGTGTALGDPIEVAALNRAFRAGGAGPEAAGSVALGSVKTNIGHLDAGAGVAGFVKAVQALRHRRIPPSLHYTAANPEVDFAGGPFYVAAEGEDWPRGEGPRRAGVSSLGIGGTNAHVILEEAPPMPREASPATARQLLLVSARSPAALEAATGRLAARLGGDGAPSLADSAWTLATGRRQWDHRAAVVAGDGAEAAAVLAAEGDDGARLLRGQAAAEKATPVAFLFPGQGAQHPGMGRGLYEDRAAGADVFRRQVDRCAELLDGELDGLDLRQLLFPAPADAAAAAESLARTRLTQPALFTIEWALARQLEAWGVAADAYLGHSLGEYVAATLAGVFTLPDALALVAARGRMMEALPPGDMLSVALSEEAVAEYLEGEAVALAAVNAPQLVTLSGPPAAIDALAGRLEADGVEPKRLRTSHAFHSPMMDPILDAFAERVGRVERSAPQTPFVSNLTGTWITDAEATDPTYWARHLRGAVRFAAGVAELAQGRALLEVGPGRTLASLARRQAGADGRWLAAVTTLRPARDVMREMEAAAEAGTTRAQAGERHGDLDAVLSALGRLWCAGAAVDPAALHAGRRRHKVGLPTYPFERQRYWVDAPGTARGASAAATTAAGESGADAAEAATSSVSLHERPAGLSTGYVAPRSDTETRVAASWETLLGIDGVGAFDDFFELGGHSLLATQVLSRLRDAFRVELPLKALFDAPTPAGLAAAVDRLVATGGGAVAPPLEALPRQEGAELPLSFAQQRLWFLHRLEPLSDAYNVPLAVRLAGDLRQDVLSRVLDEVVRRHEVLRTRFREHDGEPAQAISPPSHQPVHRVDLTALPAGRRGAETRRVAATETRRPFDLAAGPLLRATLVAEAADDHVAVLVLHHIVTDGWSLGLMVREIGALYAAFAGGEASPLEALPVQYADYAAWQRRWLSGPVLEEKVAYWKRQLGGDSGHAPDVARLPVDRPRTPRRTWGGGAVRFHLDPELADAVGRFGRERGATLFMTLLAAFQALLLRHAPQDELTVGTPVAGRNRTEVEDLIGFFVNTLVLRTDLTGAPSFAELVARVREVSLEAHAHQEVPFERLVEELVEERSLSHTPLFQVFFVLQNMPTAELELPGVTLSGLPGEVRSAKFDLSLEMEERPASQGGGIRGTFEYATDLFDAATVERLAEHFQRLLAAAVAAPEMPLLDLPLLAEGERQQAQWRDATAEEWADLVPAGVGEPAPTLEALIRARVAATPQAVALVAGDGSPWTFAELSDRAEALGARLLAAGVGHDQVVALLAQRTPEALAALLAIHRAGAAFLPIDPSTPAQRRDQVLADAGVVAVVGAAAALNDLPRAEAGGQPTLVPWERAAAEATAGDTPPLPGPATPESAAWVIYTSGSTGVPKGVVVSHRAAANHAAAMARAYGLGADDRVLQFASLAFDAALEEIFPPWLAGAAVVLARDGVSRDFRELERQVAADGVTVLDLPTAYWHEWAAEMDAAGAAPPAPGPEGRPLRLLVVGTEAALPHRLELWQKAVRRGAEAGAAPVAWVNAYGPSEATVTATIWRHQASDPVPARLPIGGPVANVTAHVLDRRLGPVPPGVPGELVLGGAGLARGYLGRGAATAERFVPDPFAERPGARLYRTGDLARRTGAGDLDFLGRVDRQVKMRGFRIEPGEVEARLAALPGVAAAAVVLAGDDPADRRLVAFVVPDGPASDTQDLLEGEAKDLPQRLSDELAAELPPYMVPSAFVVRRALPRTAGGKTDRRTLAAEAEAASGDRRAPEPPVAPRDEREEALAAIWREVLDLDTVGVHDNFFEIGGHSLKATRVIARVRRALGIDLPLREMFQRPTIAGLAAALAESDSAAEKGEDAVRAALSRLEDLSEDEVRALLAEKKAVLEGA